MTTEGQQPSVPAQGYGYPQQPPVPQGYGYPQQPAAQQPPAPQGAAQWGQGHGHGHPQQAPPQVQQPPVFGRPGTGAPAAPPRRKGRAGMVVLLVLALLVLGGAGGGAWYLLVGSSSGNVLWSVPPHEKEHDPTNPPEELKSLWFTDKAVVQPLPDGIKAYDRATGRKLWATALPGDSNTACIAPADSSGDVGVVAYGDTQACDHLAAYDLGSGEELWHKKLPVEDTTSTTSVSLARAGDVVVYNVGTFTTVLKTADGSQAWDPKRFATEECYSGAFTGGPALIRVRRCSEGDYPAKKEWEEVSSVDPATGKALWTHRSDTWNTADEELVDASEVVSTSPVVLRGETGDGGLFALDDKTGKLRSEFSPGMPGHYVQTGNVDGNPWMEAGAFGNTFVISVSDKNSHDFIAAYDLDTGKQLWKTEPSKEKYYFPLPEAGDDRVLVYVNNTIADLGPELVEFDARSGTAETVVEYPEEVGDGTTALAQMHRNQGQVYITSLTTPIIFEGDKGYSLVALPTDG